MGDVVEIALGNNQLAGELPDVLSSMKSLTALILHHNTISGTLPQSLFTIKSLKAMDLRYNKLSGSFPSELALPYLTNLSMSNNQLQGFLPSRWNCPNLEVISLSSNILQGPLPSSLSTLSKLRYLDVSQNYFTGSFPSEYSSLVSLEIIWLFTNRFDDAVIPDNKDNNKIIIIKPLYFLKCYHSTIGQEGYIYYTTTYIATGVFFASQHDSIGMQLNFAIIAQKSTVPPLDPNNL